jgi:hypothetical protein
MTTFRTTRPNLRVGIPDEPVVTETISEGGVVTKTYAPSSHEAVFGGSERDGVFLGTYETADEREIEYLRSHPLCGSSAGYWEGEVPPFDIGTPPADPLELVLVEEREGPNRP